MIKQWKPYLAGFASALALVAVTVALVGANFGAFAAPHKADGYDAIAKQIGLTITWKVPPTCDNSYGCFTPLTPDVIYVSPNLRQSETYRIVLHEMGHVMQYRMGMAQNECKADQFAEIFMAQPSTLANCPRVN